MTFDLLWPDGRVQTCYSPSLVVHDHLAVDVDYPVEELLARTATALGIASDRVLAKFGFRCTSATQTLDAIRAAADEVRGTPGATVRVLSMNPPAPVAGTTPPSVAAASGGTPS